MAAGVMDFSAGYLWNPSAGSGLGVMAGGTMFLKKLRGVRIVRRERCDGSDCEKQAESHPVPRSGARCCARSVPHFPTICSTSFSFSVQTYSPISSLASSSDGSRDFPGLRISSRIVDREFDFEMSQIGPPEALDDVHHFSVRMTRGIEPRSIVEAHGVDYQRVAFPMSDRMSHPHRIRILGMAASI